MSWYNTVSAPGGGIEIYACSFLRNPVPAVFFNAKQAFGGVVVK
jgi:hypothetical protein